MDLHLLAMQKAENVCDEHHALLRQHFSVHCQQDFEKMPPVPHLLVVGALYCGVQGCEMVLTLDVELWNALVC